MSRLLTEGAQWLVIGGGWHFIHLSGRVDLTFEIFFANAAVAYICSTFDSIARYPCSTVFLMHSILRGLCPIACTRVFLPL